MFSVLFVFMFLKFILWFCSVGGGGVDGVWGVCGEIEFWVVGLGVGSGWEGRFLG